MIVKPQKPAKKAALSAVFLTEMGFVGMGGYPISTEATQGVFIATRKPHPASLSLLAPLLRAGVETKTQKAKP